MHLDVREPERTRFTVDFSAQRLALVWLCVGCSSSPVDESKESAVRGGFGGLEEFLVTIPSGLRPVPVIGVALWRECCKIKLSPLGRKIL